MKKQPPKRHASFATRLRSHLRTDPGPLPVVTQKFASYERANFHLALEALLAEWDPRRELIGIVAPPHYEHPSLTQLTRPETSRGYIAGSPEYVDIEAAGGRTLTCLEQGFILLRYQRRPVALLVSVDRRSYMGGFTASAIAAKPDDAQAVLRALTAETRLGRAFRGQVLTIDMDCYRQLAIRYHRLAPIRREDVILPDAVLARIERLTLGLSRHADALKRAGRHLKRGLLLHGPPGTGKTLTAMYLASRMTGRTVILMTGKGLAQIEIACGMARALEPATVILEDVDLIGTERENQTVNANALLYELLNQMDGLATDCDALFILTTNRPAVLEPALAARPGRIDQAVEIPLPDETGRRRLFDLYSKGLTLKVANLDPFIRRTDGASGAFIRELLRKAALFAVEDGDPIVVRDAHLDAAMGELVVAGGALTQTLLGSRIAKPPA